MMQQLRMNFATFMMLVNTVKYDISPNARFFLAYTAIAEKKVVMNLCYLRIKFLRV